MTLYGLCRKHGECLPSCGLCADIPAPRRYRERQVHVPGTFKRTPKPVPEYRQMTFDEVVALLAAQKEEAGVGAA